MNKEQRNHLYRTAERQDGLQAQLDEWKIQLRLAHKNETCMPAPNGCGKKVDIEEFRNEISLREYHISALCQDCQDKIFDE